MKRNAANWANYNFIMLNVAKINSLRSVDFYDNVTIIKKKNLN